jgi:hypothetical protein
VISHQKISFLNITDFTHKYSEVEIKEMQGLLIDNIYVVVGCQVFQQSVGIPLSTNWSPLLADLFLHSYGAEFIQKLLRVKKNLLLWPSIRHIDISTTFYLLTTINSISFDVSVSQAQ